MPRTTSLVGKLARYGFSDVSRAASLIESSPLLTQLISNGEDPHGLLRAFSAAADTEAGLLGLVRLADKIEESGNTDDLSSILITDNAIRERLIAVLGGSVELTEHLIRHPAALRALAHEPRLDISRTKTAMLQAVRADPHAPLPVSALDTPQAYDALRIAYRTHILQIAGYDLAHTEPTSIVHHVAAMLADLASATLEAALAIARHEVDGHDSCRLAVIGMGKCGGRELNYVSDVDVIYVAEPALGTDVDTALTIGTELAAGLARACSSSTPEGTIWPVDPNLRPEGKDGPLVRTLQSHLDYYAKWAKTWEFQALLKSRPVAGDLDLGTAYITALHPLVYEASARDNFVEDARAMRRRVEDNIPAKETERQIKLGAGGLRDVEFSVQLLQMVHGHIESELRTGNTLEGLDALQRHGFVGRDDAATMSSSYRFLRALEHRNQVHRLKRTHVLPTDDSATLRLARLLRLGESSDLERCWRLTRSAVRQCHQSIFYRPILTTVAGLSADEARLTPESAKQRLKALGYRDPDGALRNIEALTEGVSRRAKMQKQLLPAMMSMFARSADPDAGLLSFRRVSDQLGSTHWYLKMLRDSGAAAERMAKVLAGSRYAANLLEREVVATQWFGSDKQLDAVPIDALQETAYRIAERSTDLNTAVRSLRAMRRREILRSAIADISEQASLDQIGTRLTEATSAAIDGALSAISNNVASEISCEIPAIAVIGMGRFGGSELGYSSDADVMFVYESSDDNPEVQRIAEKIIAELQRRLKAVQGEPTIDLDADLRPEGRNGPIIRSMEAFSEYYARWSLTWEKQALLRARPVAGDTYVGEKFMKLIDPLRYSTSGIDSKAIVEIRRMKARVEAERIPKGVDRRRHLKLGPGGLSDVEWTLQLLQLQHAGSVPELRTTSTIRGIDAARQANLLSAEDADEMVSAWTFASKLRNATMLWKGRGEDALPNDHADRDGIARLVGYHGGESDQLEEDYQRVARHARAVVERVFFDQ